MELFLQWGERPECVERMSRKKKRSGSRSSPEADKTLGGLIKHNRCKWSPNSTNKDETSANGYSTLCQSHALGKETESLSALRPATRATGSC